MKFRFIGALALLLPLIAGNTARADDFFLGKTMTIISGGAVDGNYTIFARLLAAHMGKYIPGQPSFVVQAIPAGFGIQAANQVFNVSPKDGTTFGLFIRESVLQPILGSSQAMFKPDRFNWLGTPDSYQNSAYVIFIRAVLPAPEATSATPLI